MHGALNVEGILTFWVGHVLGFMHYVRASCVTDSFGEFSANIFKMERNKEEENVNFINVGRPSLPRKGVEGPLPRRLIGESLTCQKTQSLP